MHGIGKGITLKRLINSEDFVEVFNNRLATTEDVAIAGERGLVNLYSGNKKGDTLDQLRLQKFCKKSMFQHYLCSSSDIGSNICSRPVLQL